MKSIVIVAAFLSLASAKYHTFIGYESDKKFEDLLDNVARSGTIEPLAEKAIRDLYQRETASWAPLSNRGLLFQLDSYAGPPGPLAETASPLSGVAASQEPLAETASPEPLAETASPEPLAETASPLSGVVASQEPLAETASPEPLAETASPNPLSEASGSIESLEAAVTVNPPVTPILW